MFVYVFECSLFDYNLFDYNVQMAGRKKRDDGGRPDKAKVLEKPPKKKTVRTKKCTTFRHSGIVLDRNDRTPTPPMRQATIPSMAGCDRFWSSHPLGSASATPTGSHAVVPSATPTPGSEATLPSQTSIPPSRPPPPVRNLTISVVLLFIFVRILDLTFLYYLADASTGRFC